MNFRKVIGRVIHTLFPPPGPDNPSAYVRQAIRPFGLKYAWRGDRLEFRKGDRRVLIPAHHWLFAPTVGAAFDFYFEDLESDGTLDFSSPGVRKYRRSGLEFLLTSFPEEEAAIDAYFSVVRPSAGDLVFDLGANSGVTAYRLSQLVGPNGKVIAFEPDPENYAALLDNIRRHDLKNVQPVPVAIAGETGIQSFNAEATTGAALRSSIDRGSLGKTIDVPCLSLDDATRKYGVPSYVKMDVEGAEVQILEAKPAVLVGQNSSFVIDTMHVLNGKETAPIVQAIFESFDYETDTIRDRNCVTTWARPRS